MANILVQQLLDLLGEQDDIVREAFIQYVKQADQQSFEELLKKLSEQEIEDTLEVIRSYVEQFSNVLPKVFNQVGEATAEQLARQFPDISVAISFNPTNARAAEIIASSRLNLIRGLMTQQEASIRQALSRSLASGAGPAEAARAIRDSIGLTPQQEAYVDSYRRQLQTLDSRALDRALRDQRFDGRIQTALERDRPLTDLQIDTMVARYRARAIALRAETISRTESLTAFSQAREEALTQMMETTRLNSQRIVRIWYATHDSRTRSWHLDMDGQEAEPGESFTDGLGNALRYPGDPLAPPESRINCRCTVSFDVRPAA